MKREHAPFRDCPIPFPSRQWRSSILDVTNGDTITTKVDRGWFDESTFDVRFSLVDAWERWKGTPEERIKGQHAYEYVREQALGKWAILFTRMDREKYGRILGDLSIRREDGSELILSAALEARGHTKQ
jgi:endonuclease YncB( thermonuclease family)